MLWIIGIITLFLVLSLSLVVVRLATVALTMTGLSEEAAAFQARSAFTGTGFTTSEAEAVVNHPVRRRIISSLMVLQSARFFGILISLILMFVGDAADAQKLYRLAWLAGGALVLLALSHSTFVERHIDRAMAWALDRWTELDIRDYARLLNLSGEYMVTEVELDEGDWLAGKQVRDCRLRDEGVLILGIVRDDGSYVGVPRPDTELYPGDRVIMYGRGSTLRELDTRKRGHAGDLAHDAAVGEQQEELRRQVEEELQYDRRRSAS